MTPVKRHELKYLINHSEYEVLSSVLKTMMQSDPHSNETGEYFVRSLYFDTILDDLYFDKVNGLEKRFKVRVRIYDLETDVFKLEKKEKVGNVLMKYTLNLNKREYLDILDGDYEFLLNKGDMGHLFYYTLKRDYLKPVLIVDYDREAYVHTFSNVRINFDKNVRVNQDVSFFMSDSKTWPLSYEHQYVLEVKYDTVLPDWLKSILTSVNLNVTSYSKYCIGRER